MPYIELDCGCSGGTTDAGDSGGWTFCPAHTAAPMLVEACLEARRAMIGQGDPRAAVERIQYALKVAKTPWDELQGA